MAAPPQQQPQQQHLALPPALAMLRGQGGGMGQPQPAPALPPHLRPLVQVPAAPLVSPSPPVLTASGPPGFAGGPVAANRARPAVPLLLQQAAARGGVSAAATAAAVAAPAAAAPPPAPASAPVRAPPGFSQPAAQPVQPQSVAMAQLLAQTAAQQQRQPQQQHPPHHHPQQQSAAGPSTSAQAGNRLLNMLQRNGEQRPQGSPARGEAGPSGQPAPPPAAVRALCAAFPPPEGECSFNLQRALRWLEVAAPETYAVVDKSIVQQLDNTITEGHGDIASVLLFLCVAAWTTPESIAAARSATAVICANLMKAKKHMLEHPNLAVALSDLVAYRPDVAIYIDRGLWRILTSSDVSQEDAAVWLQGCLHMDEGWDDAVNGEPRKVLLAYMADGLGIPGNYGRR